MAGTSRRTPAPSRKDDVIQIRAASELKAMLNQAAAMRGQKLSEFILDSARRSAEDALLDQRIFFLSPADHDRFLELLDAPPKPDKRVAARFKRKPVWDAG